MSEERPTEYTEFKAPVTGWEVLLKAWWILLILFGFVIYILFVDSIPETWRYGYWTFIAVFGVVYWFLGLAEGFALDTTDMANGNLGLKPLNRYQLERVTNKPAVVLFSSECGTVALIGHRLVSKDDKGRLSLHPELELKTNSEIVRKVAESQAGMIDEYLLLKAVPDVQASTKFMGAWKSLQAKMRLEPENLDPES